MHNRTPAAAYPSKFWIPTVEGIHASGKFAPDLDIYYLNIDDEGGKEIYVRLGLNKAPPPARRCSARVRPSARLSTGGVFLGV
jgi:hypothetical protein